MKNYSRAGNEEFIAPDPVLQSWLRASGKRIMIRALISAFGVLVAIINIPELASIHSSYGRANAVYVSREILNPFWAPVLQVKVKF